MNLLKDRSSSTKTLILLSLLEGTSNGSQIARELDITPQAVSSQIQRMRKERLVSKTKGGYRPTKNGIQFLHEGISSLKRFAEEVHTKLPIIEKCEAVAETKIKKGDKVNLFMRYGTLHAKKGTGPGSKGKALTDSEAGSEVLIGDLTGMLKMQPGAITIIGIPDIDNGGSGSINLEELREIVKEERPELLGHVGLTARGVIKLLRWRSDISLAVPEAALEAAAKGLTVLLLVQDSRMDNVTSRIGSHNNTLEDRIPVRTIPSLNMKV